MGRKSLRKIALGDQVLALLRESKRSLTTHEIAELVDTDYARVYQVLKQLTQRGLIERIECVGLTNVLWGVSGASLTIAQQLAVEQSLRGELEERVRHAVRALERREIDVALEILRQAPSKQP